MAPVRWIAEWVPQSHRRTGLGKSASYWVRRDAGGRPSVFLGRRSHPPDSVAEPHFYLNGPVVYRDSGFPEGPSSIPYMTIRRQRVVPAEGHPRSGTNETLFKVVAPERESHLPRIYENPDWEGWPGSPRGLVDCVNRFGTEALRWVWNEGR